MSRLRIRASLGLMVWVAVIGLCGGRAAAIVLNDGGTHLIDGPSPYVSVYDSPTGATTRLTIVYPAQIEAYHISTGATSVSAKGFNGGKAIVTLLGGTLEGGLQALDDSCMTVSGGSIGADLDGRSLDAYAHSGPAVVGISDGSFAGGLVVLGMSRVDISGGSFGIGSSGASLSVGSRYGHPSFVDITGGTFPGRLDAGPKSSVTVSGGSVGSDASQVSVLAEAISDSANVHITDGVFDGGLVVRGGGEVRVTGGTFGHDVEHRSVFADHTVQSIGLSIITGLTAAIDISGGSFSGGVDAENGRVRLSGGSFGASGYFPAASVIAAAPLDLGPTTVVEIFGGTYTEGFHAGRDGTIHVHGHDLTYHHGSNVLMGTLADGTPLSAETSTAHNGQIILHDASKGADVPPGTNILGTHTATMAIPTWIAPPPPECPLRARLVTMTGAALGVVSVDGRAVDVGAASAILQRRGEAVNPGRGPYQDTIPIELVALQLQSVEPMDLEPLGGRGTDHLFLTLQGDRGLHLLDPITGPDSTGEMTIDFAMRTYDSSLDVFFDVRAGSPDGPILFTGNDTLVATQVPWAVDLPEGWFAIPGIDDAFFAGVIGGSLVGFDQDGEFLQLRMTTVLLPEPATLSLLALGGLALLRRRRKA